MSIIDIMSNRKICTRIERRQIVQGMLYHKHIQNSKSYTKFHIHIQNFKSYTN